MKVLIRLAEAALVVFLLLLTVCTAAYRLDPEVSPEVGAASGQSLSERITTVLTDLGSGVAGSISETGSAIAGSAADAVVSTVADVTRTGTYTDSGAEILDVQIPAAAVSTVTRAMSGDLGGMVSADDLVSSLNTVAGVQAAQREDGSVSITLPEDIYDTYRSQFAAYLGGG